MPRNLTYAIGLALALALPTRFPTATGQEMSGASPHSSDPRDDAPPPAAGNDDVAAIPNHEPVVVHSRFNPRPLSDEQLHEILDKARGVAPKGHEVWFVLLKDNREYDGMLRYTVSVFFTPDTKTPRLRKGRYVSFGGLGERIQALLRRLEEHGASEEKPRRNARRSSKDRQPRRLFEYSQVSRRDNPFTDELGIPSGVLLPFPAPEGFTDDEVVGIVDFIDTNPEGPQRPGAITFPARFDGSGRIIRIERRDGLIEVHNGTCEGPLSGIGQLMRCVREERGFRVVALGQWVS